MNEAQRTVLQSQMRNIAKDIIMSEQILSSLYSKNIFESHMIEMIRAEKTKTEQTYKMLELLPKRGPDAFDRFIDIIQEDYPWLATNLQSRCRSEMERYTARKESDLKKISTDHLDGKRGEPENHNLDIKKKVHTFVHKYFGHSKKLAEKDKKLIVNWMTNQITEERIRLQSVTTSESTPSESGDNEHYKITKINDELFKLHLKLEPYIHSDLESTDNVNSYIPEDMSFNLLSDEIDQVCLCVSNLQNEIESTLEEFDSCVRVNGIKQLVEDLMEKNNKQSDQLDKEGKRNTQLIDDLSDYSEQIHKLETERAKMRYQIDMMHKDLSRTRHEKYKIQEYNKNLDNLNKEKDQIIEKLKSKLTEYTQSKTKKESVTSKSPTRKSHPSSVGRSTNFNTPLFSRRSSQYYPITTNTTRPSSQKRNT